MVGKPTLGRLPCGAMKLEAMEGNPDKRRKARRWNSDRYPKMITVRATREEHRLIMDHSSRARTSASTYLKHCALRRRLPALRETKSPTLEERGDIEFILFQIRKVGVNLNQLARRSNRSRLLGTTGPKSSEVETAAEVAGRLMNLLLKRL